MKIRIRTRSLRHALRRTGGGLALALALSLAGCAERDEAPEKAASAVSQESAAEQEPLAYAPPATPTAAGGEAAEAMSATNHADRGLLAERRDMPALDPGIAPDDDVAAPEGGDTFTDHGVNPWTDASQDRLSTFAVDVDTASFTIARRMIEGGRLPPAAAVRVEEFVNYFGYSGYQRPDPDGQMPFQVDLEAAPSPFARDTTLLRVGVQGRELSMKTRKPAHLTFLVDVSGSMSSSDKLELAKTALALLVEQLEPHDTVALVTYAGNTRVVLEPTPASERMRILGALGDLSAGGSTAMASGLQLAYEQAMATHEPGAVSRVIVVSDGDGNVGSTTHGDMLSSIQHYVAEGITMSTIGVGMGNYRDTTMEQLANRGNGNNYYFDSLAQARRVFVDQLPGTLQVIARDVKLQVEFDPGVVAEYRLVGYENRDVADEDFRNDKVDAGEIGAGHSVTALYEVRLQPGATAQSTLATVHVRHESPDGAVDSAPALEHRFAISAGEVRARFEDATSDTRFAVAVAAFAERLRQSPERAQLSFETIAQIAAGATEGDADREAFVALVDRASTLSP